MPGPLPAAPAPPRTATPPSAPRRATKLLLLLFLLALVAVLFSPLIGNYPIPPLDVLTILGQKLLGGWLVPNACPNLTPEQCTAYTEIVWLTRVPQILLAACAGAALALAGGTLQGTFRNPLADPYLLGISSGGAIGAAVVIVLGIGNAEANLAIPLFAFIGSVLVAAAILAVAIGRRTSTETLLLTGVAISSFLSAVLSLMLLYGPQQTQELEFWLLGGLGSASWYVDGLVFAVTLVVGVLLATQGRELNVLQLGPEVAESMGLPVARVRTRLILLASLVTAIAVSFTGLIGFVGLVSPHIVRRLGSTDYRVVLPASALFGIFFLVLARDTSLLAYPSTVVPIGIFTAFAGVPFFLYLLYRRRSATFMGGPG